MLMNTLFSIGDAVRSAFKLKEVHLKPYQKGYIYGLILAVQIGASQLIEANHLFGFRAFQVDGVSMNDTLSTNDQLIVDTRVGRLAAGDIVVYGQEHRFYIHRVVAVPGDTVSITGNQLLINGEHKAEPYVSNEEYREDMDELVVPSNHYFVLGDNRGDSADSRILGTNPADRIIGKAMYIYRSDDRGKFGQKLSS